MNPAGEQKDDLAASGSEPSESDDVLLAKTFQSDAWKHFTSTPRGKRCNYCVKTLTGNTTSVLRHVARCHPSKLPKSSLPKRANVSVDTRIERNSTKKLKQRKTFRCTTYPAEDQEKIRRCLSQMDH